MSIEEGVLYVVATPMGHLGDLSERARDVLGKVDFIAAEDTRVTARLLAHLGLSTRCLSLHEHNEAARIQPILRALAAGKSVALVSDAGTPLISDPGYRLVRAVREAGWRVSPVPGPSAVIAALSVGGLPTDRFVFEGFLPPRSAKRRVYLERLAKESRTLVFYESSHRIAHCIADMCAVFGETRRVVLARELTKRFEQVVSVTLGELGPWLAEDENRRRGEFVLIIEGADEAVDENERHVVTEDQVIAVLASGLPTRQAADLAARITGGPRQELYRKAQRIRRSRGEAGDAGEV